VVCQEEVARVKSMVFVVRAVFFSAFLGQNAAHEECFTVRNFGQVQSNNGNCTFQQNFLLLTLISTNKASKMFHFTILGTYEEGIDTGATCRFLKVVRAVKRKL